MQNTSEETNVNFKFHIDECYQMKQRQLLSTHLHHWDKTEVDHPSLLDNYHLCHPDQMHSTGYSINHFEKLQSLVFYYIPQPCYCIVITVSLLNSLWAVHSVDHVLFQSKKRILWKTSFLNRHSSIQLTLSRLNSPTTNNELHIRIHVVQFCVKTCWPDDWRKFHLFCNSNQRNVVSFCWLNIVWMPYDCLLKMNKLGMRLPFSRLIDFQKLFTSTCRFLDLRLSSWSSFEREFCGKWMKLCD